MIRTIKFIIKCFVLIVCKVFLLFIPKDEKLILCSAWFGKRYLDSPRYMYEYLLENSEYKVFWYTKSKKLYDELVSRSLPVVYAFSIKGIIKQVRAKLLISSVCFYDFNIYLFGKCILFDLDHGFPIKQSGFEIPTYNKRDQLFDLLLRLNVKLYASASSSFVKNIIVRAERITPKRIVFCNKPRLDAFFDESLRNNNEIVDKISAGRKIIVYMPTHRMAGKKTIDIEKIFDLTKLQAFCETNNAVFLIKKHYYHYSESADLSSFPCIFDITKEKLDVETLLYQADVLISDYSASYIDFLLLDRPIIFYAYDYKEFINNERTLYIKFEDIDAGYKAYTYKELSSALKEIAYGWDDKKHAAGREKLRNIYFDNDLPKGKTREHILSAIDCLIANNYETKWSNS